MMLGSLIRIAVILSTVTSFCVGQQTCPKDYQLFGYSTCMRITREESWYAVNKICEADGGILMDGGSNSNMLTYAADLLRQSNAVWLWVNAQSINVDNGNTWLFNDGTPMNYANWGSGFPLQKSLGDDSYITVNGHGEWSDRGDDEEHCEVICQDLTTTDDYTIPLLATIDGTSYWVSKFAVFATQAEKPCATRGGTLAKIRDAKQQKTLDSVIWRVTIDGDRKFCIDGKLDKSLAFTKSGYYWMNSRKPLEISETSYIFGSGKSLAVRRSDSGKIVMGRFSTTAYRPGICVVDLNGGIKTTPKAKTTIFQTDLPTVWPTTARTTTTTKPSDTTTQLALDTTTSGASSNSSQLTGSRRLMFTARYLLAVDCKDAMMEPQPAVLLSAARYKYKDLLLICDCFDPTQRVEYTCKQRTLTIKWPSTRYYKSSDSSTEISRDSYLFSQRAESLNHVHGPQMFAINVLKNMPPVVFPERQQNGQYISFEVKSEL